MKSPFSRYLVFVVAAAFFIPHASAQVVEIPDPNLERAIRESISLPDETPITQSVMNQLIELEAGNKQIETLTGLGYAANLEKLELSFNQIRDITPLAGLVYLKILILVENPIADLAPLANLTKLTNLYLAGIRIKDITPLSNLTQLRVLDLQHCRQIRDITPLSNLTQLNRLEISHNQIVDISPLTNLTQLTDLTIANNPITDFRPLFGLNLQHVDIDIHKLQKLASSNVKIPDPNLERVIREELGLLSETPITQLVMSHLIKLEAGHKQIADLTGLEHAIHLKELFLIVNQIRDITPLTGLTNLEVLYLSGNPISDLSPLSNLTQLQSLNLATIPIRDLSLLSNLTQLKHLGLVHCGITDITPLANLTNLVFLDIADNQITDISPLANLTTLKELRIDRNQIVDFSPLQGLSLTDLTYDEVCDLPDPPIQDRIQNRSLPSIVQGWDNGILNLPTLSYQDRLSYHDLYWHAPPFGLRFQLTSQGYQVAGDLGRALAEREELLAKNPNMLFLAAIRQKSAQIHRHYPEDWPYWLRDENGNLIRGSRLREIYLIDFRLPEAQDIIVQQAISVAKCGLYDGIFFDSWTEVGRTLVSLNEDGSFQFHSTVEEERQARLSILQRIREVVPDDFLILCNSNWDQLPLSAPYINGSFLETSPYPYDDYTNSRLAEIEDTLLWFEENAREPQINCLRGEGIPTEPPDSPNNRRWMRLFTTMSLILSDGYALYTTGNNYQEHIWYSFWDADLGQPIGRTAQRYQNVPSLYIREFTNGWAVYNRSGKAQTITLPSSATAVGNGDLRSATTFLLPDLDGEIYLKTQSLADVNGDGKINVLDLVQVANGLGTSAPDPNGDGVVNILDLVFVAQQFNQ